MLKRAGISLSPKQSTEADEGIEAVEYEANDAQVERIGQLVEQFVRRHSGQSTGVSFEGSSRTIFTNIPKNFFAH